MSEPERRGSLSDISLAHRIKEKERRSSLSAVRGSNIAFIHLLKTHRLDDLKLSQKIVELDASQHTPMTGFQLLLKHNILSAPVWDPSQNQYIGFLDIKDLASSILFSIKSQRARAKALAAAATQDAVPQPDTVASVLSEEYTSEAMFHASKSPHNNEDSFGALPISPHHPHPHSSPQFRPLSSPPHPHPLSSPLHPLPSPPLHHLLSPQHVSPTPHSPTSWDAHAERSITKKFPREKPQAETDIHAVSQEPQLKYLARRHPFSPIAPDATLYEAAKQLCGKVHRMPILGEDGRVIKIVSQSMITAFLAAHLDELGIEATQTVEATGLGLKTVVCARGDRPAIEAFEEIDNHGLSGLGVVLRDGSIVGNTSSRDLRYFLLDRGALNLDMNLVDYLGAIRQKEVEVATDIHAPLCSVGPNGSIGRIIGLLAATKYHRIYVVDPRHNTPLGVVSHTDILKYITSANCVPLHSPKHMRQASGSGSGAFRSGRRLSLGSSFDFGSRNTSRSKSPAPRALSRSKSPAARPSKSVYCSNMYCWEHAPCLTHPEKLSKRLGHHSPHPQASRAYIDTGGISRVIATASTRSQKWFNRGLAHAFAFHCEEALRCFSKVMEEDPNCAMACIFASWSQGTNHTNSAWGKGVQHDEALRHAQEALRLAATPLEKGLAQALCERYAPLLREEEQEQPLARTALHSTYHFALCAVYQENKEDTDVAFLFASSFLLLPSWQHDPAELLEVLEHGQFLNPRHAGLLHVYILVNAALGTPSRAAAAAHTLKGLISGLGSLLHAPSLIDFALGNYEAALLANIAAVRADERLAERSLGSAEYYFVTRLEHVYAVVSAATIDGQLQVALNYANRARTLVSPEIVSWSPNGEAVGAHLIEPYVPMVYHVLLRFGRWHQILAMELPSALFASALATAHYARAVSFAAVGKLEDALKEQHLFSEAADQLEHARLHNNPLWVRGGGHGLLNVAESLLAGQLEYKQGNFEEAFAHLKEAVQREDTLAYEPFGCLIPSRQTLGALLLAQKRVEEAESVFNEDLQRRSHNLWSLGGLVHCAESADYKGPDLETRGLKQQLSLASQRADVALTTPSSFA